MLDEIVKSGPLWKQLNLFLSYYACKNAPGEIIFAKISGSRSYNLALSTSDVDFGGVYVCPTSKLFGMDGIQDSWERTDGGKPDYAFHEVGHFCRLLLKGNPNIVEMLFVKENKWQGGNGYWSELTMRENCLNGVNNPKRFLSRQVVKQYLGYIGGQLERLRKSQGVRRLHTAGGKQTEKWCYNIVRLGMDAYNIAQGLEPVVFKEGEQREILMNIRQGSFTSEEIENKILNCINLIEGLRPWNNLPEYGDKQFLEDWLVKIRRNNW